MEKLSACRKRGSSIHFFSSTRMRCIMAIWPAGPPKLMQPIFSQTRKASPKLGCVLLSIVVMRSRSLGRPVMAFLGGKAQPGEQGIVNHETAFEQPMIVVAGQNRQTERNRMQPGRLRREVG